MEQICPKESCCGCKACHDICPRQCIVMTKEDNGFYYPFVNEDNCINCGLCQKVCPENELLYGNVISPRLFAAYSFCEEHRNQGSSGGVFGELARLIFQKKGIVYGAAFDKNLQLKHVAAYNEEELFPLLKSKYLQSDTNDVFNKIKENCRNDIPVLFCGTPCQCAALRKFIGRQYPNLYVIDFLCHGVPSQEMFDKAVHNYEIKHHGRIVAFNFRSKPDSKKRDCDHYFSLTLLMKNRKIKKVEDKPNWKFPFYWGFCQYLALRPTCYDCGYANPKRVGDITLGDFWGLNTLIPVSDFQKGYSAIIVNTEKGKSLLEMLGKSVYKKEYPISSLIELNPTYTKGAVRNYQTENSQNDYKLLSFDDFEKKYLLVKMDVISRGMRFIKRLIKKYERTIDK